MKQEEESESIGLLGFGVRRPVGMLMIVLAAAVFGFVSLSRLPVDLLPKVDHPGITVRTLYPGAAPEDVEERVTERLEDVLSTVGGLVRIRSSSRAEVSEILLEFSWGSRIPFIVQDVRERLDRVFLPQGAERPLILRYDPNLDPVLRIALSGIQDLVRLRDVAESEIERAIEGLPGVAAVRVKGGLEDEVQVQLDPGKLASLGVDAALVQRRIQEENLNVPGGSLEEGDIEYVVRTLNEFSKLEEIEKLPIVTRGDRTILLRDLGKVVRSHKDRDIILRVGGRESVEVDVYREDGANLVQVADMVREKLFGKSSPAWDGRQSKQEEIGTPEHVEARLPSGMALTILSDQSSFVEGAISEVGKAALAGGILAVLVCFLFLRRFSVTLLIGLAVPISVVATFGVLFGAGITLNVMSLGGLALGVGMLVDNSIVVVESITRRREEGDSPIEAAINGVREVGGAVTASTLTTIAVFAPIVFVEGIAGQTFGDQALTVVASLLISLGVALFFIPGLAARMQFLGTGTKEIKLREKLQNLFPSLRNPGTLLAGSQRSHSKKSWVLATIAGLVAGSCFWQQANLVQPFVEEALSKGWEPSMSKFWNPVPGDVASKAAIYSFLGSLFALPLLWLLGEPLLFAGGRIARDLSAFLLLTATGIGGTLVAAAGFLLWFPARLVAGLNRKLGAHYPRLLRRALRTPLPIGVAILLLAFTSIRMVDSLGRELLPEVRQGELTAELFFPPGFPLEETDQIAGTLELAARKINGVEETAILAGTARDEVREEESGPHTARLTLRTTRSANLRRIEAEVEEALRGILQREPALARHEVRRPTLMALNAPLEIEVIGEDLDALQRAAKQVTSSLEGAKGLTDLRSSIRRGNPEVRVTFDRETLARHGLAVADVARRLRLAVEGEVSSTFPGRDERIDIRVRADLDSMRYVEQLAELPVNPEAEHPLPLGAVAALSVADGPGEIRHIRGRRAAVISASVSGFDLGAAADLAAARLATVNLEPGTEVRVGGQKREMEEALKSLGFALLLAIFLVYAVMAAQFESLLQPFLILFAVPLAGMGAIFGLFASGTPLSVPALLGAVVLAGLVVNNAIVLVDRINRNRDTGMEVEESIVEAGKVRLRPILMTAATTILGMIPMTGWIAGLGSAEGSELRSPMALVVVSGLLVSTLLTLFVIPVGYRLISQLAPSKHD